MSTSRNRAYAMSLVIVYLFLSAAAVGSFADIVTTGHKLGLTWQAWTVPFLIDGVALMGKMGRSRRYSLSTQRAGMRLMIFGGMLSLGANVYAGTNLGQRAFGVLLVAGFLIVESYASRFSLAPPVTPISRKLAPDVAAARAEKARITREANRWARLTPAQKAAATREANRVVLEEMVGESVPVDAPVSPAMA